MEKFPNYLISVSSPFFGFAVFALGVVAIANGRRKASTAANVVANWAFNSGLNKRAENFKFNKIEET